MQIVVRLQENRGYFFAALFPDDGVLWFSSVLRLFERINNSLILCVIIECLQHNQNVQ